MDLIFNELSLQPCAADKTGAYKRIYQLLQTYKRAAESGFNGIRFQQQFHELNLCENYTVQDFCSEKGNRLLRTLLIGLRRYPFIEDDSVEEIKYIESDFYITKNDTLIQCHGLAAAYLYSTAGIGFLSEEFWDNVRFRISIKKNEETQTDVYCISLEKHVESREFIEWLESIREIRLSETSIAVKDKKIHLRDDHGINILRAFAKRIIMSSYIEGVVNSLPFNSHCKDFIKKINPDGTIEIVLTGTDAGYGLVVQTTGKKLKETQYIADILRKEYFKK